MDAYTDFVTTASVMIQKLRNAARERDDQLAAFKEFDAALDKLVTAKWAEAVTAWERDPEKPNPFISNEESMSSINCVWSRMIC